jgi:signal transduction histidine kinase
MLGIGISAIVMFVAAGVGVYALARRALLEEYDSATLAKARQVASLVELNKGTIHVEELTDSHLPEFERAKRPEYYQVWSIEGKTLAKSKSLGNAELAQPPIPSNATVMQYVTLPNGERGRQVSGRYPVTIDSDEPGNEALAKPRHSIVALARETHEMDQMMARLGGVLIVVSGIATVAMLALTALVIRGAIAPVDRLAGRITRMNARNLSVRLPQTAPAELSPIILGLNGLLERLENAFEREKSFTSDAAHEMRTPLAGLESALEVCARKTREPAAYHAVVTECLDAVRGMHRMIDNLLLLARADADQIPANFGELSIDQVLEDAWRRFSKTADQRGLSVSWDVGSDVIAKTDRDKLIQVVSNLFDNAVRYAEEGGRIGISAQRENGSVTVRIANSGSRVPNDDAARVFERFWRGDKARTEIGIHCGLGLSVCRKMIGVLEGTICATSEVGGDFVVEIALPAGALHSDLTMAK